MAVIKHHDQGNLEKEELIWIWSPERYWVHNGREATHHMAGRQTEQEPEIGSSVTNTKEKEQTGNRPKLRSLPQGQLPPARLHLP